MRSQVCPRILGGALTYRDFPPTTGAMRRLALLIGLASIGAMLLPATALASGSRTIEGAHYYQRTLDGGMHGHQSGGPGVYELYGVSGDGTLAYRFTHVIGRFHFHIGYSWCSGCDASHRWVTVRRPSPRVRIVTVHVHGPVTVQVGRVHGWWGS